MDHFLIHIVFSFSQLIFKDNHCNFFKVTLKVTIAKNHPYCLIQYISSLQLDWFVKRKFSIKHANFGVHIVLIQLVSLIFKSRVIRKISYSYLQSKTQSHSTILGACDHSPKRAVTNCYWIQQGPRSLQAQSFILVLQQRLALQRRAIPEKLTSRLHFR